MKIFFGLATVSAKRYMRENLKSSNRVSVNKKSIICIPGII